MDDPMAQDDSSSSRRSRRSTLLQPASKRMQDTGKSLYELTGGGVGGRSRLDATEVRTKWNNASVAGAGARARRCASAGDCFILGRLCAPFRLAVPFLLPLPLLLQCAWSSRYNPAKGQSGRQAGIKKAATVLRPHRMKMSTTWRTTWRTTMDWGTVSFQRIANWNWNWKKRNERNETEKRRKKLNRTEMNSGRANWPSSWLPAGQEQERAERICCCCCWWHNWRLFPGQMPSGSDASPEYFIKCFVRVIFIASPGRNKIWRQSLSWRWSWRWRLPHCDWQLLKFVLFSHFFCFLLSLLFCTPDYA